MKIREKLNEYRETHLIKRRLLHNLENLPKAYSSFRLDDRIGDGKDLLRRYLSTAPFRRYINGN